MDRRELAFESGLKALGDMAACKDPVSAVAIYGGWLSGSIENRIAADLKVAQDFAISGCGPATDGTANSRGLSAAGGATPDRAAGTA